jgi:gas vesicle protein
MNKLLLGLLAGVAIGIALAPDKGSKTRQKIREGFDDFKKKAGDAAKEFADEVDKGFEKVRTAFNGAAQ